MHTFMYADISPGTININLICRQWESLFTVTNNDPIWHSTEAISPWSSIDIPTAFGRYDGYFGCYVSCIRRFSTTQFCSPSIICTDLQGHEPGLISLACSRAWRNPGDMQWSKVLHTNHDAFRMLVCSSFQNESNVSAGKLTWRRSTSYHTAQECSDPGSMHMHHASVDNLDFLAHNTPNWVGTQVYRLGTTTLESAWPSAFAPVCRTSLSLKISLLLPDMADNKAAQVHLDTVDTHHDVIDDLKASGNHEEEVRIARLTEDDFITLSAESLTMRSKTGLRICLYMFVHGTLSARAYSGT